MFFFLLKKNYIIFFRILYEMITEKRAWARLVRRKPFEIYDIIRDKEFEFFKTNSKTGYEEIDELIELCVNRDPKKRPTAGQVLKRIS